jgi:hypothetical protein
MFIYQNRSKCSGAEHLGVMGVENFLRIGKTGEEEGQAQAPGLMVDAAELLAGIAPDEVQFVSEGVV